MRCGLRDSRKGKHSTSPYVPTLVLHSPEIGHKVYFEEMLTLKSFTIITNEIASDEIKKYVVVVIPCFETWISNPMSSKIMNGITYPFPNFSGATVEVWE